MIDQSLDIMQWALDQNDPDQWQVVNESLAKAWIDKNDGPFQKAIRSI
ncbi:hypothetical protein [Polynucleobacter necessarius]|nr:hypothetical protein [Polynucleobacter necessarius]